jgi:hypothetical protein
MNDTESGYTIPLEKDTVCRRCGQGFWKGQSMMSTGCDDNGEYKHHDWYSELTSLRSQLQAETAKREVLEETLAFYGDAQCVGCMNLQSQIKDAEAVIAKFKKASGYGRVVAVDAADEYYKRYPRPADQDLG